MKREALRNFIEETIDDSNLSHKEKVDKIMYEIDYLVNKLRDEYRDIMRITVKRDNRN